MKSPHNPSFVGGFVGKFAHAHARLVDQILPLSIALLLAFAVGVVMLVTATRQIEARVEALALQIDAVDIEIQELVEITAPEVRDGY